MKRLHTLAAAGLALAALAPDDTAASAGTTKPADDPKPETTKDAKSSKAADKAEAPEDDGKARYRITAEFADTTTGRVRKKGRTLTATAKRAEQLIAARVIDPTPLDDDADDQDDDDQNADVGVNTNAVAPATVGGVVDAAVIADRGEGAAVTDGHRDGKLPDAVTTGDAPAIVTGKGKAAK